MIMVTARQLHGTGLAKDFIEEIGGFRTYRNWEKKIPLSSLFQLCNLEHGLAFLSRIDNGEFWKTHDALLRSFASWCALRHVGKLAKYCSGDTYSLIVQWLNTNDPNLRHTAASEIHQVGFAIIDTFEESGVPITFNAAMCALESARATTVLDDEFYCNDAVAQAINSEKYANIRTVHARISASNEEAVLIEKLRQMLDADSTTVIEDK